MFQEANGQTLPRVSALKKNSPDKPRKLEKSVTVE